MSTADCELSFSDRAIPDARNDFDHLRLLSCFHYVLGACVGLLTLTSLLYVTMGIKALGGSLCYSPGEPPLPAFAGIILIGMGTSQLGMGFTAAAMMMVAGRRLSRRTNPTFCLVVALLECLLLPFGTVLGILTIVVLVRPSVKQLFAANDLATA
jgi:hypothetical protein